MNRKLGWAWIAALVAVVCYFAWTWGELHDRVASHFDAAGNPNGYQTKDGYLGFFLGFIFSMNGVFAVLYFLIERVPTPLINMPRKDYWLATEERKAEMFGKLKGVACLLGLFVNLVLLFTTQVIYQANATDPFFKLPITGGVAVILIGMVCLTLFSLIILRPPSGSAPPTGKDKSP